MCVRAQMLSCVQLLATPWTVTHQAPLSMEFSMQEYRSGQGHHAFHGVQGFTQLILGWHWPISVG